MLVITPKELIDTLSRYNPDELLLVTWWSTEDVEMLVADNDIEIERAKKIWADIVFDLDNKTSDHVISYVNDEMDSMVYKEMEEK
jgi:hypothetical protein